MKKTTILIALLLLVTMISGCNNEKGNNIHIGVMEERNNQLSIGDFSRSDELTLLNNLYRGLFEIDQHQQVVPVLAEDYYYNEDGTMLTIAIGDNHTWSDGTPVTAEDAKNTLVAAMEGTGKYAYQYSYIASHLEEPIRINEEGLLEIDLQRSFVDFHKVLAMPIFYPVKNPEDPLAGPFSASFTVETSESDRIILVPDSERAGAEGIVTESVIFSYGLGQEELIEKYNSNDFDVMFSEETITDSRAMIDTAPGIRLLWLNSLKDLFSDQAARHTLAESIDSRQLVRKLKNSEEELQGIYPDAFRETDVYPERPDFEPYLFEGQSLQMLVFESETNRKVADAIKEQVEENTDLSISLQFEEADRYLERLRNADFDLALETWEADYFGKNAFFELFRNPLSSPLNLSAVIDPEKNQLQADVNRISDLESREEIFKQIEALIYEKSPAVFLTQNVEKEFHIQRIKNVIINPIYKYHRYDQVTY